MSHNIEWNLTGPADGNRSSVSTTDVIRHASMTSKDTEAWETGTFKEKTSQKISKLCNSPV
jgi:hypothetical protein